MEATPYSLRSFLASASTLGAENLLGAQKDSCHIAVEIKSFLDASSLQAFHLAVGQFVNYCLALSQTDPKRIFYLAIEGYIYSTFFQTPFGQVAQEQHRLKMLIFDEATEVIQQWIE